MKQTITFTIQVAVDKDKADELGGYPGTMGDDPDPPISGLQIEAHYIMAGLLETLPKLVSASLLPINVWWQDVAIGSPQPESTGTLSAL